MEFECILYDVKDKVLTITLNRPDRLNAYTGQMQSNLIEAFDKAGKDDDIRAIIVTGAGRGFCAGADLGAGGNTFNREVRNNKGETEGIKDDPEWMRDGGGRTTLAIFDCPKPIIAAFNGPAVGVGVTMTLPMDIRIASEEAKFGFVFARRGLVPEAASSWFLPRVVGINKALEWTFSGRVFSPEEAKEGGLDTINTPGRQAIGRGKQNCARNSREYLGCIRCHDSTNALEVIGSRSSDGST
ncbi:MAG: hypothetical protein CM1200mP12_18310 [Gammaproteobacteria bacterium]|nr:MAG: hypothetical protein CM1200mP12_18310 [Gammaproteobacteria bacterium]